MLGKTAKKKTTKSKTKKAAPKRTGNSNAIKKTIDGIIFDSTMEADYYEYLKTEKVAGRVLSFKLQPEYALLDSYEKYGKKIRGIKYIADFLVEYEDKSIIIIDVKGYETADFKLKRKMFDYKYSDLTLKLIQYNKATETWDDYDELKKLKAKKKREKNKIARAKLVI